MVLETDVGPGREDAAVTTSAHSGTWPGVSAMVCLYQDPVTPDCPTSCKYDQDMRKAQILMRPQTTPQGLRLHTQEA